MRRADIPRPCRLNPEVPRALEAVCRKALACDPARRYQSAGELGDELRRYLAGEPVRAWREPLAVRVGRRLRHLLER